MLTHYWKVVAHQLEGATTRVIPVGADDHLWVGLLSRTTDTHLVIDLASPPELVLADTEVSVDVLHFGGLYRFRTLCCSDSVYRFRLRMNLPDHMEVVQRRTHPRIPVAGDLACWSPEGDHIVLHDVGRAIDLSIGGLSFEANEPPSVGSHLFVQFKGLPGRVLGVLETEVLRTNRTSQGLWTVAVAFRNLRPDVAAELFQIVQGKLLMQTGYMESAVGSLE